MACEDEGVGALKMGDDETTVDLYRRIVSSFDKERERSTGVMVQAR